MRPKHSKLEEARIGNHETGGQLMRWRLLTMAVLGVALSMSSGQTQITGFDPVQSADPYPVTKLILPSVQKVREAAARSPVRVALKEIGLANQQDTIHFIDLSTGQLAAHPVPCTGCGAGDKMIILNGGLDASDVLFAAAKRVRSDGTTDAPFVVRLDRGTFNFFPVPENSTVFNTGSPDLTMADDGKWYVTAPGVAGYLGFDPQTGQMIRLRTPSAQAVPAGPIAPGPVGDVNVYMTLRDGGVAKGNDQTCVELAGPKLDSITLGPDANLWGHDFTGNRLWQMTPAGMFAESPLPPGCGPRALEFGPDGKGYVACESSSQICQHDPATKGTLCSSVTGRPNGLAVSGTRENVQILYTATDGAGNDLALAVVLVNSAGAPDLTVKLTSDKEARAGDAFIAQFSIFNEGTAPTTGPFTLVFEAPGFEIINAEPCSLSGSTATCTYSETLYPGFGTSSTSVRMAPVGVSSPTHRTLSASVSGGGDVNFTNNFSTLIVTVLPPRNIAQVLESALDKIFGRRFF